MIWSDRILSEKRILITGASSGIGRVCAVICSQLGAQIVAMGRNVERLEETINNLHGEGHNLIGCDLTDSNQIQEKLSNLKTESPISGFIHCAGIEQTNPLKGIDAVAFSNMFNTNVLSAVEIIKIISSSKMRDKNGGSYVIISSVRGIVGGKGLIEYSCTKSAIYGLIKSSASELACKMIRINCISPAYVNTPMLKSLFGNLPEESIKNIESKHLLGIIEPEDVANLCVYLLSDLGRKITGTNIILDSGYLLA